MSGPLSLEGSLKTCKVSAGMAPQVFSDRIIGGLDSRVCPMPRPYDDYGREANIMSLTNKSAGCNDPLELVAREIEVVRPRYFQFINLNPEGVFGDFDNLQRKETIHKNQIFQNLHSGQFGQQMSSSINTNGKCHLANIGMVSAKQPAPSEHSIVQSARGYRTLAGY